jgi:hypothetical protein
MTKLKTSTQIRAIFGLAKRNRFELDDDAKAGLAVVASNGRTDRLSLLTFAEANVAIKNLGGEPFEPRYVPRRTENYRRPKAGVKQIAQPAHLELMYKLAAQRNMSSDGLERMGRRMIKTWPPRTTDETNKVVEALKSMNRRDRINAKSPAKKEAA